MTPETPPQERMYLHHEAEPGFRPWFYAAVVVGVLYLVLAFSGVL